MNPQEPELSPPHSFRHEREISRNLRNRRTLILSSVRGDHDMDPLPSFVEDQEPSRQEPPRSRLDNRAREQLAEVELALRKMEGGGYGICENCLNPISPRRLRNLPEARLCLGCERELERGRIRLAPPEQVLADPRPGSPENEGDPADALIRQRLLDHLARRGIPLSDKVSVTVHNRITFLDGSIASENQLHDIMDHLADSLDAFNCSVVVNRLDIVPPAGECSGSSR